MKKIFLGLFAISVFSASAQTAAYDTTFRPNSYALKVEQFRSFPNSKKDIIFLGNSITANTDWMELLGNKHARNRGISGDITFGVVERLDEVTEGKPKKIFLLIGINDISRNIPDALILRNYHTIISRIKQETPKTKIYIHTLLPVNNEFTQFKNHYNKDEHILYINDEIRKLAAREGAILIDVYPLFLDADNKLDKKYTVDGLHLNALGYKLWAGILKSKGGLN